MSDVNLLDWLSEDRRAAQAQGWNIFHRCDGRGDQIVDSKPYGERPFELQACDEAGIFDGDHGAWKLVFRRAPAGVPFALKALTFLAVESPGEFALILEHRGWIQ